jgi:hypothetical protein
MTKRKNHNSILFLTTLSVYFGLVLVGATPQVLAQAATTRVFNFQTEIEIEDDLDKKPDDEKALAVYASTLQDLFLLARDFSARDAEKLRGDGRYEFDCFLDVYANGQTTSCTDAKGSPLGGFVPLLEKIGKTFPHAAETDQRQVRVNLILNESDFGLKTALTQNLNEQAEHYSSFFDACLSKTKSRQDNQPQAIIYQNTSVSFENNQVFIVTRLPRASLDALVAKNAQ